MRRVIIAGEAWELPLAALSFEALCRGDTAVDEVIVPPELAGLTAQAGPAVRVVGAPPGRFRGYDEIVADLVTCQPGIPVIAAGSEGSSGPAHRPPEPRRHVRRQVGELDIWTADTGDGYFDALLASGGSRPSRPVWTAYGSGRPVFTRNTNDFRESPPSAHDDYVILGSGLLGWRMVVESDPAPGARVLVYDINPEQLAWSQHVLDNAEHIADLGELERSFGATRPTARIRDIQPHERANADRQEGWYRAHHEELAALSRRVRVTHIPVDLLTTPSVLLDRLASDRTAFFMYLDLFTVWHIADVPPWIVEFPCLARSLERAVLARTAAATFLPREHARTLQLAGSPFVPDL